VDPELSTVLNRVSVDSPLPCNFEQILASDAVRNDPLRDVLFNFPREEVELLRHDKHLRTVQGKDVLEASADMPLFVQDALAFYRDPWEVLHRKFEGDDDDEDTAKPPERLDPAQLSVRSYPEGGGSGPAAAPPPAASASSDSDVIRPELLKEDNKTNPVERHKIFDLYRGVPPLTPVKTPTVKPYEESFGRVIMFKPEELRFKVGDLEPFFCRASVYELSSEKAIRMSEDFCFEANAPGLDQMLKGNPGFVNRTDDDPVTASRICLFNIPVPSTEVYLVLRLEKILSPDLKGVSEAYVKVIGSGKSFSFFCSSFFVLLQVDPSKPKDVSKWKKLAASACGSVPFKAPFGFAILPLFNDREEFVGGKNVKFLQVFRQALTSGEVGDEALFRVFADQKATTKMKTIPASFTCTMEDVSETFQEIPGRVDPSLTPCLPEGSGSSLLRELQSLPRQQLPIPYLHYVNNFYVRPESFVVPKNVINPVVIRVQLLDDDKEGSAPLPAIFGGFKEPRFVTEHTTPVAYNPGKMVMWYSELK
jgi:hypothetical protein